MGKCGGCDAVLCGHGEPQEYPAHGAGQAAEIPGKSGDHWGDYHHRAAAFRGKIPAGEHGIPTADHGQSDRLQYCGYQHIRS